MIEDPGYEFADPCPPSMRQVLSAKTKTKTQTWNLSNVLHKQEYQIFQFTREKGVNCDIFDKKLIMEGVLFIYFDQNFNF